MHPQLARQHDAVQQEQRRALAAFDDADGTAVVRDDVVVEQIARKREALVLGGALRLLRGTTHGSVLRHPRGQGGHPGPRGGGRGDPPLVRAAPRSAAHRSPSTTGAPPPSLSAPALARSASTTTRGTRGPTPQTTS